MQITRATAQDASAYAEMDLDLDFDYVWEIFPELAAGGGLYKAAEGGQMIGLAMLRHIDAECAYLTAARVDRRHRNRGVITTLSQHLIQVARERGYTWVGLCTDASNLAAGRAAEKIGLHLVGRNLSCNCHRAQERQSPPVDDLVAGSLPRAELQEILSAAYSDTGVLPRLPYGMIPWPGQPVPDRYLVNLQRFDPLDSTGERRVLLNALSRDEPHLLFLSPAPALPSRVIQAAVRSTGPFPAVHMEFPVRCEDDWRRAPKLPDGWHVHRYLVFGRDLLRDERGP